MAVKQAKQAKQAKQVIDKSKLVSISLKNSKLGFVPSFSTTPGADHGCAQSETGGCDPNADHRTDVDWQLCYVWNYYRQYKETRDAYNRNLSLIHTDLESVESQIKAHLLLTQPKKFRWHVSGDIISLDYLQMMVRLAKRFKQTIFLAYTKAIRVLRKIDRASIPDNLIVFISSMSEAQTKHIQSDNQLSQYPIAYCSADLDADQNVPNNHSRLAGYVNCPEQITDGKIKCDTCQVCWQGKQVRFYPH